MPGTAAGVGDDVVGCKDEPSQQLYTANASPAPARAKQATRPPTKDGNEEGARHSCYRKGRAIVHIETYCHILGGGKAGDTCRHGLAAGRMRSNRHPRVGWSCYITQRDVLVRGATRVVANTQEAKRADGE